MTTKRKPLQPLSRRQFLGLGAGVMAGTAALNGLDVINLLPTDNDTPAAPRTDYYPPTQFDREVFTLCEQCVWRCGVRAKVKDERVYKLEGNSFHPHSRGVLCPRGQAGIAALYDPDRLQYPLIRKGGRGEGQWTRASWEEALDYVAGRMLEIKERYGPEAMIFSSTSRIVAMSFCEPRS